MPGGVSVTVSTTIVRSTHDIYRYYLTNAPLVEELIGEGRKKHNAIRCAQVFDDIAHQLKNTTCWSSCQYMLVILHKCLLHWS